MLGKLPDKDANDGLIWENRGDSYGIFDEIYWKISQL